MLTDFDRRLITAENKDLKPVDFSIERILRKYHAVQITCHWYDSDPPECNKCERWCDDPCNTWIEWNGSEAQLTHEVWVDIWGEGIWGMSQADVDKFAVKLFKQRGMKGRLFYVKPSPDEVWIYYYHRDVAKCDYWCIFKEA